MTWRPVLAKAPARSQEVWTTNAQVYAAWSEHVGKRGAKNTQRNLRTYVAVFVRMFDPLVTTLERQDIENFVASISGKCAKLMNGAEPQCLAKLSTASCPFLQAAPARPGSCPKYQPLSPSGTWSYICAVNRFYEWLLEEGRVACNPCLPVMRDFMGRHAAHFDERRRKPRRRNLTLDEVRALVTRTPIHHGIAWLLMAKGFLRIHEVLKLSVDPAFLDLEEGWMDIPTDWDLGDKRKGNKRIILDSEARRWVRLYLAWRDEHVARGADGAPVTNNLLITVFGHAWGAGAKHNLNTALHTDAIRLGLMTGMETRREDRVNSHCFRAFATTQAKERNVSHADLQLMRGDLAPGSIERYDDYLRRLPNLYRQFGPRLGV